MPSNIYIKGLSYPRPSTSYEIEDPQSVDKSSIRLPFPFISLDAFPPKYDRRRAYLAKEHPVEVEMRGKRDGTTTTAGSWSLASVYAFPVTVLKQSKRVIVDDIKDVPVDIVFQRTKDAMRSAGASFIADAYNYIRKAATVQDASGGGGEKEQEGLFEVGEDEFTSEEEEEEEEEEGEWAGEEITHIAFHRAESIVALATSFSRIHFFDMKTNVFLPHYLSACKTTDPKSLDFVQITALAFGAASTNSLAVGLDSGYFDLWYVDLSNSTATSGYYSSGGYSLFSSPYDFQDSPTPYGKSGMFPQRDFFKSKASPGTHRLLGNPEKVRARSQRFGLLRQEFEGVRDLVGGVSVIAFSPRGEYIVVGTSLGGVWVHCVTWGTSERVYHAAGTSVSCIVWEAQPGEDVDVNGKSVIVVGMKSGLVVYLHFAHAASYSESTSQPIEFYPAELITGVRPKKASRGIKNLILVPTYTPVTLPGFASETYPRYPTLIISFSGAAGIYIFRLKRNSVLKAVSPPSSPRKPKCQPRAAAAAHSNPQLASLIPIVLENIKSLGYPLLNEPPDSDPYIPIYSKCINTDSAAFKNQSTPPELRGSAYGGVVENMALDPTGQRLIVTFSRRRGEEESVVWFDTRALMTPAGGVKPVGVLRHSKRDGNDGGGDDAGRKRRVYGSVGFVGGFKGGACAGLVEKGGKGVSLFPAWLKGGG